MSGGSNVKFPGPSPQEEALQAQQAALLKQQSEILASQYKQTQLLAPILYKSAGVTPTYDPQTGEITGFTETPDPLKERQQEVASALLDRQLAALKGELPDNPQLLKDISTREQTLNETLRKNLGPGWQTGTAGGEQLNKFATWKQNILEAGRRGDLSLAEQLGISREAANSDLLNQYMQRIAGVNANPLATAAAYGGAAAGYNAPLANLMQARQGTMQASAIRGQLNQAETAMWLNFASDTIGAVAGGVAASSGRLKKDIVPFERGEYGRAMKKLRDTPITTWRYKWEPPSRPPHVGPILELSPREIHVGDGVHVDLLGYSGMLHAGLKSLDRDVQTLRHVVEGKGATRGQER